jgi:uncharacterized protein YyaL (SSP411 family)
MDQAIDQAMDRAMDRAMDQARASRPIRTALAGAALILATVSCGAPPPQRLPAGAAPARGRTGEAAAPASGAQAANAVPARAANRLIRESSPYLLLHAHDPVDWYPWGDEAIEKARRESKPIFLSVGYSTCYWCHVMEREVFSKPAIAALMNQWFVSIKVDREERPDLDEIYIAATELMSGSAGWPNSLFLTPDLEPFFSGTYFPPEDRDGQPGFPSVLRQLHGAWESKRPQLLAQAHQTAAALRQEIARRQEPAAAVPPAAAVAATVAKVAAGFDPRYGGFESPPKFPSPGTLSFLWEAGDAGARRMVVETLRHMGEGAIYDQLAGGFHRYARDAAWRIPHFEKMLYDNALMGELLAVVARQTGDGELAHQARGTLDFLLDQMTLPGGGFKSAIDAETGGVEGACYLWTSEEARAVLGQDGYQLVAPILGLTEPPNFPGGRTTLYLTRPLAEHARRLGISPAELRRRLAPQLDQLRRARARRPLPLIDDKALADWNGMAIAALATGGEQLGEPRYTAAAVKAARFVLARLRGSALPQGPGPAAATSVLLHAWRNGEAKIPAFLDDYAFLIRGLLALQEATGDPGWRREATRLADEMQSRLADPRGGYFNGAVSGALNGAVNGAVNGAQGALNGAARPHLLFQSRTATDGAIPSGNAVAVLDLLRLGRRAQAEASLRAFARDLDAPSEATATLADAVFVFHGGRAEPPGTAAAPAGVALAKEVVKATVSVQPASAGGWRPFVLDLDIRGGWHVNANPASLDYLIPTRVEGALRRVSYPPGQRLRFPFAPDEIAVYTGRATIRGEIAPAGRALQLTYQPCDDRRCLPPVHATVPLP